MTTVLEYLVRKLRPKYVGYDDQYRAILYVLGIPPDADAAIVLAKLRELNTKGQQWES